MEVSETPTPYESSTNHPEVGAAELERRLNTYHLDSSETSTQPVGEPADAKPVSWDGPHDSKNPQNWSTLRKWLVMTVNGIIAVNVYVLWVCSLRLPADNRRLERMPPRLRYLIRRESHTTSTNLRQLGT